MDIQALLLDNKVYLQRRLDEIFVKSSTTHETVCVYRILGSKYIQYDKIIDESTGKITWCDPTKNIILADLVETNTVPYSEYIVSKLLERMVEGEALTKICKDPQMPSYSQLLRWIRVHPWIKQAIEDARIARAEYHRDQVLEESLVAESRKDPIEATKVRIDANKWLAGVDDAKYRQNNKIEAVISVPTQIVVQTGIQRDERVVEDVTDKNAQSEVRGDVSREMLNGVKEDQVS